MRLATKLRYVYLSQFSKPASDRGLYRTIAQTRPKKVLEIGIGSTERTLRMLDLAKELGDGQQIRYAAVDMFEARAAGSPKLSLKEAHRLFKSTSYEAQLIPGDPQGAIARVANSISDVELVVISSVHDDASLAGIWFFLPRMLHAKSHVLREVAAGPGSPAQFRTIEAAEIRDRAGSNRRRAA